MFKLPTEVPVAERARWLAELSDVLDQAHQLLFEVTFPAEAAADALDLFLRLEAARQEVHFLRLSRSLAAREELEPDRAELIRCWPETTAS